MTDRETREALKARVRANQAYADPTIVFTDCDRSCQVLSAKSRKRRKNASKKSARKGPPVESRSSVLRSLGFDCYKTYLRSKLWWGIRELVLSREAYQCQGCGRGAECVHHRQYDKATMAGDTIGHLVAFCHSCHGKVEFKANHVKRLGREVDKMCRKLIE